MGSSPVLCRPAGRHSGASRVRLIATCILTIAMLGGPAATAAQRMVLGEEFTATWCGHCRESEEAMAALLENYADSFTYIQIQGSYQYNTSWNEDRRAFYQFWAYPTVWFDGVLSHTGDSGDGEPLYDLYEADVLAQLSVPTDVKIALGGEHLGGSAYRVTVRVGIEPHGAAKDLRVHVVHALDYYPASTDDRRRNCVREPLVPETDIYLLPGENATIQHVFEFDDTSMDREDDIRIVAWAQSPTEFGPAAVHNAAMMRWPFTPLSTTGDTNCDGEVDFDDINPFVVALAGRQAYNAAHPGCEWLNADCNDDGDVDFHDINPFVAILGDDD